MSNEPASMPAAHQARRVSLPEGAPRVRITAGVGSASQKTWNLRRPVAMVGSRRTALVHLSNPEISKAHCLIVNTGSDVLLRDLASRSGTFCDERPVELEPLRDGAVIRVGPTTIQVAIQASAEGNEDTETGYQYSDPTKLPTPLVLVDSQGRQHQIERSVAVIGRRGNCDVPIDSNDVSLAHAAIFHIAGRPVLYDLGSRNGTFINGQQVSIGHIGGGDVLRIDDTEFTVEGPPLAEETGQETDEQSQVDAVQTDGDGAPQAPDAAGNDSQDNSAPSDTQDVAASDDSAAQTPPQSHDPGEDQADAKDQQDTNPGDDNPAQATEDQPANPSPEGQPEAPAETVVVAASEPPPQRPPRPDRGHAAESLSDLQTKIVGLQENILNWWDQLTDWQNRLEQNTHQLQKRSAHLEQRDQQVAEREQALQAEQQHVEQQKQQLENTQHELDARQQTVDSQKQELDAAQHKLDDKQKELDARDQQLKEHHNQLETQQAQFEQQKGELEDLRGRLDASQKDLQQARGKLEEAQAKIEDERRQLHERGEQLESKQKEIEDERRQLHERSEQLESKQKEIEERAAELQRRESELQQREQDVQERAAAIEQTEKVVHAEQAVFSQFQQAINQANDAFQQSLTQRIATMQSLMESAGAAQESADSLPSSVVEPVAEPPADHQTQPEDAPTGESTPDQQSGDEPQDAGQAEPESSAAAAEQQHIPDGHVEGKDDSADATGDQKSDPDPSPHEPENAHASLRPTFSMDLEPEVADKLRTLRRLTNGKKSDDELLAEIRAEAELQSSNQSKKRRWWGSGD